MTNVFAARPKLELIESLYYPTTEPAVAAILTLAAVARSSEDANQLVVQVLTVGEAWFAHVVGASGFSRRSIACASRAAALHDLYKILRTACDARRYDLIAEAALIRTTIVEASASIRQAEGKE